MCFLAPNAKLYLFCATLLYGFFQYFLKSFIFFGILMTQKKSANLFLLKFKVQKSKNVNINYFNRNLKFYKDWITEENSQKQKNHRKKNNFFLIIRLEMNIANFLIFWFWEKKKFAEFFGIPKKILNFKKCEKEHHTGQWQK